MSFKSKILINTPAYFSLKCCEGLRGKGKKMAIFITPPSTRKAVEISEIPFLKYYQQSVIYRQILNLGGRYYKFWCMKTFPKNPYVKLQKMSYFQRTILNRFVNWLGKRRSFGTRSKSFHTTRVVSETQTVRSKTFEIFLQHLWPLFSEKCAGVLKNFFRSFLSGFFSAHDSKWRALKALRYFPKYGQSKDDSLAFFSALRFDASAIIFSSCWFRLRSSTNSVGTFLEVSKWWFLTLSLFSLLLGNFSSYFTAMLCTLFGCV